MGGITLSSLSLCQKSLFVSLSKKRKSLCLSVKKESLFVSLSKNLPLLLEAPPMKDGILPDACSLLLFYTGILLIFPANSGCKFLFLQNILFFFQAF